MLASLKGYRARHLLKEVKNACGWHFTIYTQIATKVINE